VLSNGKAAVELSFRLELDKRSTITSVECPACGGTGTVLSTLYNLSTSDPVDAEYESTCQDCDGNGKVAETYLLCGHFDKIVSAHGHDNLWIKDIKTTKSTLNSAYFKRYSPDNQVSFYSYSGKLVFSEEIKGVIIDGVQIKTDSTEFCRREIERSETTLAEWITDAEYYISLAEVAAERNYYPMNDKACSIPRENPKTGEIEYSCPFHPVCASAPEIRQTLLDLNFDKRTWDPLKPR
jgi:RecJ-like exonuclease